MKQPRNTLCGLKRRACLSLWEAVLGVMSAAEVVNRSCGSIYYQCLRQTEDQWWDQAADWRWPAESLHWTWRILPHATAYDFQHTTLFCPYAPLLHFSPYMLSINQTWGVRCNKISVGNLFMQAMVFMGSYLWMWQEHMRKVPLWQWRIITHLLKHTHISAKWKSKQTMRRGHYSPHSLFFTLKETLASSDSHF